jgi:hypothetical protein
VSEAENQLSSLKGDIRAVRERHVLLNDKLKVSHTITAAGVLAHIKTTWPVLRLEPTQHLVPPDLAGRLMHSISSYLLMYYLRRTKTWPRRSLRHVPWHWGVVQLVVGHPSSTVHDPMVAVHDQTQGLHAACHLGHTLPVRTGGAANPVVLGITLYRAHRG